MSFKSVWLKIVLYLISILMCNVLFLYELFSFMFWGGFRTVNINNDWLIDGPWRVRAVDKIHGSGRPTGRTDRQTNSEGARASPERLFTSYTVEYSHHHSRWKESARPGLSSSSTPVRLFHNSLVSSEFDVCFQWQWRDSGGLSAGIANFLFFHWII